MADILVRDLDEKIVKRLKAKAEATGRSLQQVAHAALEREADEKTAEELMKTFEKWQSRLAGGTFDDSAASIREDRAR